LTTKIRRLFGQRIKKIRKEKGISQEELAFSCGLHRTYISDVERGTRNVSIDNIYKISRALDIPLKYLFDFET
jgi:transcriptional regulator with XRE-family HTH domain